MMKNILKILVLLFFFCAETYADTRTEYFLDITNIDECSGITVTAGTLIGCSNGSVNRPSKYSGNPLYPSGTNNHTWDYDKDGVSLIYDTGTLVKMWLFVHAYASQASSTTYQYSSDGGNTFTRPDLGDGTNRIVIAEIIGIQFDTINNRYVGIACVWGGSIGLFIVSSTDGITGWTLQKTVAIYPSDTYVEGNSLVQITDGGANNGKWIAYGIRGHSSDARSVHAWMSDTTNIAGTWTYQGNIISAIDANNQIYTMGIAKLADGLILAYCVRYNKSTELLPEVKLFVSRNGLSFTLKDSTWFITGSNGTWDDSGIFYFNSILTSGNKYRIYYPGTPVDHATNPNRDDRIGYVEIGKGRIGQVSGTGNIVSTTIVNPTGYLYINANGTGGTIKAELLDGSNNVITGYSQAESNTVSSDTYSTEMTWNGNHIPQNQTVKVKFYLSSAILYSYELDVSTSGTLNLGSGGSINSGTGGTINLQ